MMEVPTDQVVALADVDPADLALIERAVGWSIDTSGINYLSYVEMSAKALFSIIDAAREEGVRSGYWSGRRRGRAIGRRSMMG